MLCILIYAFSTGVHLSKMWFWVYWGTARTEKVCFIIILVFCHCYLTSLHKKERKTVCVYCLVLTMAPCRPSPVDPRTSSHLRYFLTQLFPSKTLFHKNASNVIIFRDHLAKLGYPLMVTLLFFKSFMALLFIFVAVPNLVTVTVVKAKFFRPFLVYIFYVVISYQNKILMHLKNLDFFLFFLLQIY